MLGARPLIPFAPCEVYPHGLTHARMDERESDVDVGSRLVAECSAECMKVVLGEEPPDIAGALPLCFMGSEQQWQGLLPAPAGDL